jgi:hypothetical protein
VNLSERIAAVERRATERRQAASEHYRVVRTRLQTRLRSPVTWMLVAAAVLGGGALTRLGRRKRKPARVGAAPSTSAVLMSLGAQVVPMLLSFWLARHRATSRTAGGKRGHASELPA